MKKVSFTTESGSKVSFTARMKNKLTKKKEERPQPALKHNPKASKTEGSKEPISKRPLTKLDKELLKVEKLYKS